MGLVPSAVTPAQIADPPRRAGRGAPWLVLLVYLAGAVALTWRLWADPGSRMQVGDPADVNLFAWFIRYSAESVAHGSLPALVTTAMNPPHGINLMWNTSLLLPGVLMTPVTLLAGPQTSLTVLLTLGFAGSAASMYWVLRRWGVRIGPAALGGAVYGFSPAMLASAVGHYHLEFAVLPPLMIDAGLRIITGRGPAVKTGIWLGLLVAAQFFIGEELLVDTVLAAVVLVIVVAVTNLHAVAGRAGRSVTGLATAAVVAVVICGYALWVQFHGPLAEHGSPWNGNHYRNRAASFVTPSGNMLLHTGSGAAALAAHPGRLSEYVAYLGYPLIVLLIVAAVVCWRDLRVRVAALAGAVLEILSLGGTQVVRGVTVPPVLLPWHWAGPSAGAQPDAAEPVVHPGRRAGCGGAGGLARPGPVRVAAAALAAPGYPGGHRRDRGAAADPAADAHLPGRWGAGRVPGGVHPAGAAPGRPRPRGARAVRRRLAAAALVRGDGVPRLDDRRLLHRAQPDGAGRHLRRPRAPGRRAVRSTRCGPRPARTSPRRRPRCAGMLPAGGPRP